MSQISRGLLAARTYPLVTLLLTLSLFGTFIGSAVYPIPRWMVYGGLTEGHYWRLITPIFVHFGLVHFIFNALWLAILGTRVERLSGSIHLLLLIFITGLISNMGQFVWSGSVGFGGMSGVIYGLLGYIWIRNLLSPDPLLLIPKEVIGFMLFWLFFCMTGIPTFLLGIGIANAAHFLGLLMGMLLGLVFGLASVSSRQ